eukprot:CAMPEP_0177364090 /NCGR_PEP_ID=MMETSP0368-20130122/38599_1 /TAXON_ID=447022 ORGANISM="Scrippsiella hangoei-like, Strain SHHI-4" /NCGR_SAMPLE_ID=MMETSP0368 /ASSEMBLY_ACC=CAM_ASM_000363 /LENGTH=94 /DNA_ID=CAMNT_0018826917 /DNA_START=262 /DNA_END=543 /DNA_ORIENTATION=-
MGSSRIKFLSIRHTKYCFDRYLQDMLSWLFAAKHLKYSAFRCAHSLKWSIGKEPLSGGRPGMIRLPMLTSVIVEARKSEAKLSMLEGVCWILSL